MRFRPLILLCVSVMHPHKTLVPSFGRIYKETFGRILWNSSFWGVSNRVSTSFELYHRKNLTRCLDVLHPLGVLHRFVEWICSINLLKRLLRGRHKIVPIGQTDDTAASLATRCQLSQIWAHAVLFMLLKGKTNKSRAQGTQPSCVLKEITHTKTEKEAATAKEKRQVVTDKHRKQLSDSKNFDA